LEQTTHRKAPVSLDKLRALDTCTVSNAIERLNVRLRNEGFVAGVLQCRFPELPPMVGYAATGRIRTASPPMTHRCYYDRMDWWDYVASLPEPRVMVLQDVDPKPGVGAFVGEIHATIGLALECVGCVTNGGVRDLPAVGRLGFQLFSGSLAVSHSYAHIVEFGEPVEIGGLKISPGDLIHGDRHGVLAIPGGTIDEIPGVASQILAEEQGLKEFCHSPEFSLAGLAERLRNTAGNCDLPWKAR
jgi:4-hydroxy-4-methyl-2-oxoglutarate aldolase